MLGLLLEEFPDVTISKIRFLESQGLIEPERTPSGYRKFYEADVERLRLILREQREHFLPLRVIKDRLDSGEIEPTDATPPRGTTTPHPADTSNEEPTPAAVAKHPAAGRRGLSPSGYGLGKQAGAGRRAAEQLAPTPASTPRPMADPQGTAVATSPRPCPACWSTVRSCVRWRRITLAQLEVAGGVRGDPAPHGLGASCTATIRSRSPRPLAASCAPASMPGTCGHGARRSSERSGCTSS